MENFSTSQLINHSGWKQYGNVKSAHKQAEIDISQNFPDYAQKNIEKAKITVNSSFKVRKVALIFKNIPEERVS